MNKYIITMTIITAILAAACSPQRDAAAISQAQKMHGYNIPVTVYDYPAPDKAIYHRKGKVTIERIETTSKGVYGVTKGGEHVAYDEPIPKGARVVTYLHYNPDNNADDDIEYIEYKWW